ncbi:MAG: hypothetical protein A2Z66_00660 [Chloroflexi bacterium RBG_13_66_10]|nr:MAG: hypothetical protein A2Z66_00660 [Chloroflexi bacterium RBG_13_66_10]
MSSRAGVVLLLLVASLAAALISGKELFFNLAYAWGGFLLLSFVWSRTSLAGVSLEREARSARTQVGYVLEERISLVNRSRFPKVWVEFDDHSDLLGHRASNVSMGLRGRHERVWAVRTLCLQRGSFRLGPGTLRAGDPFGLFPVTREVPETEQVVVMPMTARLSRFALPPGHRPGGEALRHRTHQVTPSAAGVRDYAPGDALNRIHWPSTARRLRLIVKEFELDPKADIWILLDAARQAQAGSSSIPDAEIPHWTSQRVVRLPDSTEEYAVAAAASIAVHLGEEDRAVGLISYGSKRLAVQPDRGRKQLARILESLAILKADGSLTLEGVLKIELRQIPRGASVVLITPETSSGLLSVARQMDRRGLLPILVLVDAQSFGGDEGTAGLAGAAERAGFVVRVIRRGDDLGEALSRLQVRRAFARAA